VGDWNAAPREEMPEDNTLLTSVVSGIQELNVRYNDGCQDRFHLFHRRRLWNQSEGEWVGWEKKRGKLREFNRLLRGQVIRVTRLLPPILSFLNEFDM